jgi:hypothetical protein
VVCIPPGRQFHSWHVEANAYVAQSIKFCGMTRTTHRTVIRKYGMQGTKFGTLQSSDVWVSYSSWGAKSPKALIIVRPKDPRSAADRGSLHSISLFTHGYHGSGSYSLRGILDLALEA